MSDELVIQQCSPTLAGIKTGNIFSCVYSSKEQLKAEIRKLNSLLVKKGLRMIPLKFMEKRALVYLYRPAYLKGDLLDCEASKILKDCGYDCSHPELCIVNLVKRLEECSGFPHEIGLFLGYPPEDVKGFIENNARDYKFAGCWKVYGDEEKARMLFAQYKKCTEHFVKQLTQGSDIERLAVAM